ncbi:unnamed protein product [Linum tenue]|uniref:Transmembrane protein n=1 Tax=Linum tenue TaxID=586396 RepID=A0AAV0LB15_9ROSI|nr:unnamed protein product [Linum tenue]
MGSVQFSRSSILILWVIFIAFPCFVSATTVSLVVGERSRLEVSPSLSVVNSPGTKPGTRLLCERVHVHGLSRLKNLKKFSHSLKVNLTHSSSTLRGPSVEVCFHRNASRGIGMCPQGRWEKVVKGSWGRAMSPFDHKLLDIRMAGSSPESIEVHIEEEFFMYRIVFLVVGVVLLSVASPLSMSLAFYYSSAMAVGIILVILVVLFQLTYCYVLCRLVWVLFSCNTCQAYCTPSSWRWESVKTCIFLYLAIFMVAFIVLAGAWMGFWAVRKLVLAEDGSVDTSTSHFVAWSIRIIAAIMILQSSLDPLLATGALLSGIIASSVLRRTFQLKFWRRLYKRLVKMVNSMSLESAVPDISPFRNSQDNYTYKKTSEDCTPLWPWTKRFRRGSPSSAPIQGFGYKTIPQEHQLSDSDVFLSTYCTPEGKKFSKEEWKKLTEESTQKAVKDLVASPDFSRWVASNADRISVTPKTRRDESLPRRKWLYFF